MGLSDGSQLAVYYHTHWDREWYLPYRLYQVRLAEVVDDVLERLEQNVLPCFMLDGQTAVLEDYLELRPQNRGRLRQLIVEGRLSIGPWFVMPDEFLVSGESLIRNLVQGIRESDAWGCHQFTGYLPDTFGHSADMPTLFRQCGIDSAVVWRGINPKQSLFQWQSPSRAEVLTLHLTDGYFQMMLHDWTLNEAEKQKALDGFVKKLNAVGVETVPRLVPIGGDHLGPVTGNGHQLLKQRYPKLVETTPEKYLSKFSQLQNLDIIGGELIDNSGSFLLPGVYSSRMYLKQANRRLEHRLVHQVEPLLALAKLAHPAARYPAEELHLAWKTLILNHPHDSICGCSVDAVHRENEVRFDQVSQLTEALMDRAAQSLSEQGTSNDWVIFNTSDAAYTGVVSVTEDVSSADVSTLLGQVETDSVVLQDEYLHDSQRIPLSHLTKVRRQGWMWAENVPAFSVSVVSKNHVALPKQSVTVTENTLDNGQLSIHIQPDGTLTIQDAQTSIQYSGLLQFVAHAEQGDSYNSAPVPGRDSDKARFVSMATLMDGPLVGILELTHCLEASETLLFTQVRLDAGSTVVQFKTTFINQTENRKLQVGFETKVPVQTVLAESHLSTVARQYDPNYRELDYMPAADWKELKTNTGPIQRFISANGQSWITEGLCEYEVYQSTVWLTLLRGFSHLSKKETGVRGAQAGPPFETPEGQCLNRELVCRYAWTPTPSNVQTLYHLADRFYGVVWGRSGSSEAVTSIRHGLVTWEHSAVVASACYWKEGSGLVLRLLNTSLDDVQIRLTPAFSVKACWTVNFLETLQEEVLNQTVVIPGNGVQTLLLAV